MTMSSLPPRAILSEHLEERLRGRRILAAVFLTFRFDPAFFEQDILPSLFDIPLNHAPAVRMLQLEDALRSVRHGVAVYYDRNGLIPGAGGARLDIKRIPVSSRAIFHAKNVFVLVEEGEGDESGERTQSLIAAALSANLTRAGWWENVEVCHTEEIAPNSVTRVRDDLIRFLDGIDRRVGERAAGGHAALESIRTFLRRTTQGRHRTARGRLHTHFFGGGSEVSEFLERTAGESLAGMNLEIISPYFDERFESLPIHTLVRKFAPRETRILLPLNQAGEVSCTKEVFDGVLGMDGLRWGRLPQIVVSSGKAAGARPRFVHAKVYRFFQRSPKRELLFVGSMNLTSPAHSRYGNVESGFLVEVDPPRRPDWWLEVHEPVSVEFSPEGEDEGTASSGGTSLSLRFLWNEDRGEAFWDESRPSPRLKIMWADILLFDLEPLRPRAWWPLDPEHTGALKEVLRSTSFLTVHGERAQPGLLLVQEEGMHARPSILLELTPAEILRYWSLLTPAQRAEFINTRAPELADTEEGQALLVKVASLVREDTFFDRFAGIFLAFGCLERTVEGALPENPREAAYRLFGQKYDSLPNLLNKVVEQASDGQGDLTEHYVTLLCARQVLQELRKTRPDFFSEYRKEDLALRTQLNDASMVRKLLADGDPERMPGFLDWFDASFLRRAVPGREPTA